MRSYIAGKKTFYCKGLNEIQKLNLELLIVIHI